ncbi:PorV/PorQ family protein [bacterium]|nr:PorV/PorQ family protein [bacterium]
MKKDFRKKIMAVTYLIVIIMVAKTGGAEGTAGAAGAYLKMGIDARALGMGGAYTAVADDAAAVYWNPAGLAVMKRQQLAATYTLFPEGGDYSQFVYAMPLNVFSFPEDELSGSHGQAESGTLGISLIRYAATYNIEARRIDSLNPDYLFSDIEGCYQLAYGIPFYQRFYLGLGAKGLYHELDQANANGWGFDAGLTWRGIEGLRVAVAVRDVYSQLHWSTGIQEIFPMVFKLGAVYDYAVQAHGIMLSLEGENNLSEMPTRVRIGTEYRFHQLVFVRGGYNDGAWAMGGGIRIPSIGWGRAGLQLDYAAQENRITGWDHWMSMKVNF